MTEPKDGQDGRDLDPRWVIPVTAGLMVLIFLAIPWFDDDEGRIERNAALRDVLPITESSAARLEKAMDSLLEYERQRADPDHGAQPRFPLQAWRDMVAARLEMLDARFDEIDARLGRIEALLGVHGAPEGEGR